MDSYKLSAKIIDKLANAIQNTEYIMKVQCMNPFIRALVFSEVARWLLSRRPSTTSSTQGVLKQPPTEPMPSLGSVLR